MLWYSLVRYLAIHSHCESVETISEVATKPVLCSTLEALSLNSFNSRCRHPILMDHNVVPGRPVASG